MSKALAVEVIADACHRFRDAIHCCDPEQLPVTMRHFPEGPCGDAVLLLGRYLKEGGFGAGDYVCGWRIIDERRTSHAWLQIAGFVVDITADQFPEINESVIVSRSSEWHASLEGEVEHEADFHVYDDHTVATLAGAYALIVSHIQHAV